MPKPRYAPMSPRACQGRLPIDERYIYQPKWNGHRVMADIGRSTMRLISKNGDIVNDEHPTIVDALGPLQAGPAVYLDGEMVAFRRLDTRLLVQSPESVRSKFAIKAFMPFDILEADGHDCTRLSLQERQTILATVMGQVDLPNIRPVDSYQSDEFELLWDFALLGGYEGVVAKRLDSTYTPGRTAATWLKSRFEYFDDPAGIYKTAI